MGPTHRVPTLEGGVVRVAQRERRSEPVPWTVRSVVVVVSNLDRSARFYEHVLGLREAVRDAESAVLCGHPGSPAILLRQAFRNALRPGGQGIGMRAIAFDMGSLEALDGIEARLRELEAFEDRHAVGPPGHCVIVRGHDPDRVPLGFFAITGDLSRSELDSLRSHIYRL